MMKWITLLAMLLAKPANAEPLDVYNGDPGEIGISILFYFYDPLGNFVWGGIDGDFAYVPIESITMEVTEALIGDDVRVDRIDLANDTPFQPALRGLFFPTGEPFDDLEWSVTIDSFGFWVDGDIVTLTPGAGLTVFDRGWLSGKLRESYMVGSVNVGGETLRFEISNTSTSAFLETNNFAAIEALASPYLDSPAIQIDRWNDANPHPPGQWLTLGTVAGLEVRAINPTLRPRIGEGYVPEPRFAIALSVGALGIAAAHRLRSA